MNNLIPLLVVLPIIGGILLLIARRGGMSESAGEKSSVLLGLICLGLSVYLTTQSAQYTSDEVAYSTQTSRAAAGAIAGETRAIAPPPKASIQPRLEYSPEWFRLRIPANATHSIDGWELRLGMDGIGSIMVILTALITCCVLVIAKSTIEKNRSDFAAWLLIASGCLQIVFLAMDLVLFYIGFELVLIPLFVLIAGWGDRDSAGAAKRFVLYTLAGSIPMVLALLGIALIHSPDRDWLIGFEQLSELAAQNALEPGQVGKQFIIFCLLVLGLGIKTAVLPLHTWLPTTYGAAHPTCSAFLAAVVLKLGLFGFLRLALPFVPNAVAAYGPWVLGTLGAVAIVYGAMAALAQKDLRLLMAYSSLSHVGFITLGMFALNVEGIAGATLQMFNHGLTTAAMFLLMACLMVRRGSQRLDEGSRGIANHYPKLAFFLVFFVVAGAGMPGLNNFVGEFMAMTAMINVYPVLTGIAALGIVLGAWYALRMTQNILFGKYDAGKRTEVTGHLQSDDLSFEQKAVFGPLAILSIVIGVMPLGLLHFFRSDAERLAAVCSMASWELEQPIQVSASDEDITSH